MSLASLLLVLFSAEPQPAPMPRASAQAEADSLLVCPQQFLPAIEPLLAHRRALGHRYVYVSNEQSAGDIRSAIRKAAEIGSLKSILLVGDADPAAERDATVRARSIPAHKAAAKVNVQFGSEREIGTDNWYADLDDDEIPDVAIGRLPADSPRELSQIVAKILAYETRHDFGLWRQRVNFVAGVGGFGQLIDSVTEITTKKLLTDGIPAQYTTSMTFGSWRSPFCPDPRLFHNTALARHNEGCLFWVYIGHGHPQGLDNVQVPGGRFHILNCRDCSRLDATSGPPIAVMLACYTAAYDRPQDCLAEDMLRAPGGPVAIYGGSRVTMPYAMAVMGTELLDEYFKNRPATLGEVVLNSKRNMVKTVVEAEALQKGNRVLIDGIAALLSPVKTTLEDERKEHLHLFNLIGDPNLRLVYPETVAVTAVEEIEPGQVLHVSAQSPLGGRVTVELLARRDTPKVAPPTRETFDPSHAGLSALQTSYDQANDKVWAKAVFDLPQTRPERTEAAAALPIQADLPVPAGAAGPAHVRVFVQGPSRHAVGVSNISIRSPSAPAGSKAQAGSKIQPVRPLR